MKNLYPLLLGALITFTNSSSLLAQDENRFKATNQVIGCRLQVVGSNQETACRKQGTDDSKKTLPLGAQIGQGAKFTTNYEPPTTNCDNSAGSLNCHLIGQGAKTTKNYELRTKNCNNQSINFDCYLMMNPETTQELEDAVKLSRSTFLSSEASSERGVLNAVQTPLIEGEGAISAIVPSQGDVIKNNTFNFEEKVVAIREQIKEATQASKEVNGGRKSYLWSRIVTKLKQSRDSWNKFGELFRQGEEERAFLWKKMAEESEASAEKVKQLMSSCISKDENQLEKEVWNFYYLSDISTLKLKSKDAEIKAGQLQGKEKEFWQGLAQQYQEAADYEQRALEVDCLEDEKNSCVWIGRYLYSSAKRKLQAIEAKAVGKDVLAIGYQDAAGILEKAIEEEKKALTVYALGKEGEAFDYSWLAGAIQHQANYQVEMIEAQERGKIIRVEGYREVLEILQRGINLLRLSALALEEGREKESVDLHHAGELFQEQANYQAKMIEAEESGKTELAKNYQEAIETLKKRRI